MVGVLDKTLEKVLRKYKLTLPTLLNKVVILFSFIMLVLAFLFIGFHALTDTTNVYVGAFNSIVVAVAMMAVDTVINAKKDKELQEQDINVMVKDAITDGIKTIQFLSKQVDMGVLLMEAAKQVPHVFAVSSHACVHIDCAVVISN